jgi:hypothetical protein
LEKSIYSGCANDSYRCRVSLWRQHGCANNSYTGAETDREVWLRHWDGNNGMPVSGVGIEREGGSDRRGERGWWTALLWRNRKYKTYILCCYNFLPLYNLSYQILIYHMSRIYI